MYYKLKLLIGDVVMKFDINIEKYQALKATPKARKMLVKYYTFSGRYGLNHICLEASALA
ncbi:hypothetical protein D3C76_1864370 [compost metagenome]